MVEFASASRNLDMKALQIDAKAIAADMAEGEQKEVAAFTGVANKYKVRPNAKDPTRDSYNFTGSFAGFNLVTGETIERKSLYLPGYAEELLASMMAEAGDQPCEFVFKIILTKASNTPVGYKFGVMAPRQPERSNRLAQLAEELGLSLPEQKASPAIAAPAPAPAKKAVAKK